MGKKDGIFAGAISATATSMKKSRKPLLSGGLALVMILGVSGWSFPSKAEKTQQLTILSQDGAGTPRGKLIVSIAKAFTKSTGIQVKVLANGGTGGSNAKSFYESSVVAKKEADLVLVNLVAESTSWMKIKATIPLTKYLKEWGLTKVFTPQSVVDWSVNGQLQAFPVLGFQWPVMYNMALLEKAGIKTVPKTYDELVAAATKLRAIGVAPLAVGGNDWSGAKLFFQVAQDYLPQSQAIELFQKGGYCQNPRAMKGIDLFVKMRDAGVFVDNVQGLSSDNMSALYNAGKAAFIPQGSWAFTTVPADIEKSTAFGGLPVPADGVFSKPTAFQGTIGMGLWISPNGAKKLDPIKKFVKFFFSPAVAASWLTKTGDLVDVKLSNAQLKKAPHLLQLGMKLPAIVNYAVLPDVYLPQKVGTAINPVSSLAFSSGTSSSQICGALDQLYK